MITLEHTAQCPKRKDVAKQGKRSDHRKWVVANISKKASGSDAKIVKKQVSKIQSLPIAFYISDAIHFR
ncbi:MAG: hypothetical protein QM528_06880 [Phycisphaerales bacterium]|nr:hypothetical protein [Phycisphaerales bacterium]